MQNQFLQWCVLGRLKVSSLWRDCLAILSIQNLTQSDKDIGSNHTLLFSVVGMFLGYVGHDAFQERAFRFYGFDFGWFMTLAEVSIMIVGALVFERPSSQRPPGGTRSILLIALVGSCVAASHGSGNTALRYTSYPVKVAFKSCKLVPTMALGVCFTGRTHSIVEYIAGFIMCAGLFLLSIAESLGKHVGTDEIATAHIGSLLLLLSTCLDSIVPNLQEKLLQQAKVRTVDMVFLSNLCMAFILACYTFASGELRSGLSFCKENPLVLKVLVLQGGCAYFGLRCYLTVIREHGGVAGVLLTNARKIVTIVLSFLLFSKPCRAMHLVGLCLVFVGVYIGVFSKYGRQKKQQLPTTAPIEQQNGHEHVV